MRYTLQPILKSKVASSGVSLTDLKFVLELDDSVYTTATDAHTTSFDFSSNGAPTVELTGKLNYAASFYTNSAYESDANANTVLSDNGDLTIGGWVNLTTFGSAPYIGNSLVSIASSVAANVTYLRFGIASSGIVGYVTRNGTTLTIEEQGSALSLDTWYHICLIKSGDNYSVYVNGSQVGTTKSYTNGRSVGAYPICVGNSNDYVCPLNGKADQVFVFTRAISEAELGIIVNSGAGLIYPWT